MPAPDAVPLLPLPPLLLELEPGARVGVSRRALLPQAADAEIDTDEMARIVSTARTFFMTSSETVLDCCVAPP